MSSGNVAPEWALATALLKQVLADAASHDPERREDVCRFVRAGGVRYWGELLGLEDGVVEAYTNALEQALVRHTHRRSAST